MFGMGVTEILLIALILILFFGARKIPVIARGLGEGIRNFKASVRGRDEPDDRLPPEGSDGEPPP